MLARELRRAFRGGNQQSGPTTSDMPEPFKDPSGDGMEWLCKPAASEDNVCGWFTVCQPKHLGVLTSLTDRAARMRIRKIGPSRLNAQRFELAHPLRATRAVNLVKTRVSANETPGTFWPSPVSTTRLWKELSNTLEGHTVSHTRSVNAFVHTNAHFDTCAGRNPHHQLASHVATHVHAQFK